MAYPELSGARITVLLHCVLLPGFVHLHMSYVQSYHIHSGNPVFTYTLLGGGGLLTMRMIIGDMNEYDTSGLWAVGYKLVHLSTREYRCSVNSLGL